MGLFSNPLGYAGYNADTTTAQVKNSTVRSSTLAEEEAGVLNNVYISPKVLTSSGGILGPRTAHGVILGEGLTNPLGATAAGTDGQVLTGNTGADPAFAAIGTKSGLTAHGLLIAEGASAFVAAAVGTDGQVMTGNSAADPAFAAIGTKSGLTAHGVLLAEGASAFVATAVGATGTVLAGTTGADPSFKALSSLNIVDDTTGTVGTPTQLVVNTSYIADEASVRDGFLLPATAALGDVIKIIGNGPGGWQIQQNANQAIKSSSNTTTTGTSGTVSSNNRYDCIELFCVVSGASTIWNARDVSGTLTFV